MPRARRPAALHVLPPETEVRHFCRGYFGTDGVRRTGLKHELPRSAWRLCEHAKTVKASLENPDLGLKPLIELQLGEVTAGDAVLKFANPPLSCLRQPVPPAPSRERLSLITRV